MMMMKNKNCYILDPENTQNQSGILKEAIRQIIYKVKFKIYLTV